MTSLAFLIKQGSPSFFLFDDDREKRSYLQFGSDHTDDVIQSIQNKHGRWTFQTNWLHGNPYAPLSCCLCFFSDQTNMKENNAFKVNFAQRFLAYQAPSVKGPLIAFFPNGTGANLIERFIQENNEFQAAQAEVLSDIVTINNSTPFQISVVSHYDEEFSPLEIETHLLTGIFIPQHP